MTEKNLRILALAIVKFYMDGKITKDLQDRLLLLVNFEIKSLGKRG